MRRGGGKNIRKSILGRAEENDEYIEAGAEESFPTKDT